jgi:tRNA(Ile)-lysidine synthase
MGGRLHPAVARVRRGVRETLARLEAGGVVVVACSGGADSLALASASVFEGHKRGLRIVGATVDHGLQEGSAAQAATVVGQLATLGVDETVSARVRVEGAGLGPEAAARSARLAVLGQIAERFGAGLVLLGHTRDDQAETVLLGLTHGAGGRSLSGMRREYAEGPVVFARPLLEVPRDDTVTACQVEGLAYWTDPHNADPAYTRARIRTRVLPVLEEELGPGVAETLARTAPLLRADMDHLDDLADAEFARLITAEGARPPGGCPPLPVEELDALPWAIRSRVLRRAALCAGGIASELTYDHVRSMDALVRDWHGQQGVDLPGHLRAVRRDGAIHLEGSRPRADG